MCMSRRCIFDPHRQADALYPRPGVPVPVPPHRQWLAIAGSCGQPRDGDVRAMYALYDAAAAQITFHRVAYDHLAAVAAVRASGQPGFLPSGWKKAVETMEQD